MSALKVLVPIADSSEEIETACITDTLVRAGAQVTVASVTGKSEVKMSRGLRIVADKLIDDCKDQEWDAIVLPGGMSGAAGPTCLRMCRKQSATLLSKINLRASIRMGL